MEQGCFTSCESLVTLKGRSAEMWDTPRRLCASVRRGRARALIQATADHVTFHSLFLLLGAATPEKAHFCACFKMAPHLDTLLLPEH